MERINTLYYSIFGKYPQSIDPIAADGSSRQYFRIGGEKNIIATIGDNIRENKAFLELARHFRSCGLPVPDILGVSDDSKCYLQSDCGDRSLFDVWISEDVSQTEKRRLLVETVKILASFNYLGAIGFPQEACFPCPAMNRKAIMWDLNYFKYCFLKLLPIEFDEDLLETDMEQLASLCEKESDSTIMLRDFQSRNIMIDANNEPIVIDFQGARKGSGIYDLGSLLWQARLKLDDNTRACLVDTYVDKVKELTGHTLADVGNKILLFRLLRLLQVLGAYGFRGYIQHKAKFITPLSAAIGQLKEVLQSPDFPNLPYLHEILNKVVALPQFNDNSQTTTLEVKVMSFSYKKGIPEDFTGNGGGFVFDCRALHNPGRYDQYKKLTGRDAPVIEFLESSSDIAEFLSEAEMMVDRSVKVYIERGFTNLMVCFGCTGGRHRSLYCADKMAVHLKEKFGVKVNLIHREQNIHQVL